MVVRPVHDLTELPVKASTHPEGLLGRERLGCGRVMKGLVLVRLAGSSMICRTVRGVSSARVQR